MIRIQRQIVRRGELTVALPEKMGMWRPELAVLDDEVAPVVAWFRGDDDGTQHDGARQMETLAPSGASSSGGLTRTEGLPNPGELQLDGAVSAQRNGTNQAHQFVHKEEGDREGPEGGGGDLRFCRKAGEGGCGNGNSGKQFHQPGGEIQRGIRGEMRRG